MGNNYFWAELALAVVSEVFSSISGNRAATGSRDLLNYNSMQSEISENKFFPPMCF